MLEWSAGSISRALSSKFLRSVLKYSSSSSSDVLEEKSDDNILALVACLGGGSVDCGGVKERASWTGWNRGSVDKRTNKDAANEADR